MIGAILLKRSASEGFAAVDRHDLDAIAEHFHEDAVFEYPGETVLAGRYVGRAAIRAWFEQWFEFMPEIRFTIRHTAVEDIFALTVTNDGYVEWELDQKDRAGKQYHVTGITKFRVEGGKFRHVKDYIYDQVVTATAYPLKGDVEAEASARIAQ